MKGVIYYTTEEAAREVGVNRKTLIKWEENGNIPTCERDYRNYRIWTSEIVESAKRFKAEQKIL